MDFAEAIDQVLPAAVPHRDLVVAKCAEHLALIEEANRQFNLTRISGARDAAIKHVLDSIMPWKLFDGAKHVLDAGTGAGFPGIPLALALPDTRFTLAESIQKKARFVESAVAAMKLENAVVVARRAEEVARESEFDIITARAVAPIARIIALIRPRAQTRMLLYKGPDAEQEIADAGNEARRRRATMRVAMRYELPESQGTRTIVEVAYAG